jgi:light-regulated signal transduction histidine kinase (bacteriophytochrome)
LSAAETFGVSQPITLALTDSAHVTRNVVSEVPTLYPDSDVELSCDGHLIGRWDAGRVGQVLANLMANALQDAATGRLVSVVINVSAARRAVAVNPDLRSRR